MIEWYGMTEVTSSPIACNPLPPRKRKAGSVGRTRDFGCRDHGRTRGFAAGWPDRPSRRPGRRASWRATTATQRRPRPRLPAIGSRPAISGYFDDDGYLFLVGRTREIINRGGEKIAPQEVDEVLLDHPAVAEAVTFAVPHPTLGEDVAAAVVLRPQRQRNAEAFVSSPVGRLADFKVPRQVCIVKEIPKGPTGKVKRVGLAEKLGVASNGDIAAGSSSRRERPLEKLLAGIWHERARTRTGWYP